jgi:TnpA family transposase
MAAEKASTASSADGAQDACHLPDMLIFRKLGTASRKNKLYFAFRELGPVVRSTFLLKYIGDEDLSRIIQAAQNKCEGFS